MWQMGGIGPMLGQVHHFVKYNKGKAPYAEERYSKEAQHGVLDRRLEGREFLAGEYSIADIATWPWISRFEWRGIDLNLPNVKRWYPPSPAAQGCRRHSDAMIAKISAPWLTDFSSARSMEKMLLVKSNRSFS